MKSPVPIKEVSYKLHDLKAVFTLLICLIEVLSARSRRVETAFGWAQSIKILHNASDVLAAVLPVLIENDIDNIVNTSFDQVVQSVADISIGLLRQSEESRQPGSGAYLPSKSAIKQHPVSDVMIAQSLRLLRSQSQQQTSEEEEERLESLKLASGPSYSLSPLTQISLSKTQGSIPAATLTQQGPIHPMQTPTVLPVAEGSLLASTVFDPPSKLHQHHTKQFIPFILLDTPPRSIKVSPSPPTQNIPLPAGKIEVMSPPPSPHKPPPGSIYVISPPPSSLNPPHIIKVYPSPFHHPSRPPFTAVSSPPPSSQPPALARASPLPQSKPILRVSPPPSAHLLPPLRKSPPFISSHFPPINKGPPPLPSHSPLIVVRVYPPPPPSYPPPSFIRMSPPLFSHPPPIRNAPPSPSSHPPPIRNAPPSLSSHLPPIRNAPPSLSSHLPPIRETPPSPSSHLLPIDNKAPPAPLSFHLPSINKGPPPMHSRSPLIVLKAYPPPPSSHLPPIREAPPSPSSHPLPILSVSPPPSARSPSFINSYQSPSARLSPLPSINSSPPPSSSAGVLPPHPKSSSPIYPPGPDKILHPQPPLPFQLHPPPSYPPAVTPPLPSLPLPPAAPSASDESSYAPAVSLASVTLLMDGGPIRNPQLMGACPSNYYYNYNTDINTTSSDGIAIIQAVVQILESLGNGQSGLFLQPSCNEGQDGNSVTVDLMFSDIGPAQEFIQAGAIPLIEAFQIQCGNTSTVQFFNLADNHLSVYVCDAVYYTTLLQPLYPVGGLTVNTLLQLCCQQLLDPSSTHSSTHDSPPLPSPLSY